MFSIPLQAPAQAKNDDKECDELPQRTRIHTLGAGLALISQLVSPSLSKLAQKKKWRHFYLVLSHVPNRCICTVPITLGTRVKLLFTHLFVTIYLGVQYNSTPTITVTYANWFYGSHLVRWGNKLSHLTHPKKKNVIFYVTRDWFNDIYIYILKQLVT